MSVELSRRSTVGLDLLWLEAHGGWVTTGLGFSCRAALVPERAVFGRENGAGGPAAPGKSLVQAAALHRHAEAFSVE